jgi:hypothetical protein
LEYRQAIESVLGLGSLVFAFRNGSFEYSIKYDGFVHKKISID